MTLIEILLIAVALSMDAFVASIIKGMTNTGKSSSSDIFVAFMFGLFQAIMPMLGYFLGEKVSQAVSAFDHYIAFILLSFIGVGMILDYFDKKKEYDETMFTDIKSILLCAIATSIDAFTVGVTLSCLNAEIINSSLIIGTTTFVISFLGTRLGKRMNNKFGKTASLIGGIILISLGTKILIEHLAT